MKKKRVVVIGGGTGTIAVLSGLKAYTHIDLSVIVSMTDDGGSNAIIRDEFGLLPLSDLRKSIIALAPSGNDVLRQIFTYRFHKGDGLSGHTLGNLIMMGLSEMEGGEVGAIEAMSRLFQLEGKVIPVTLEHTHLVARYDDGAEIKSEHLIDESQEAHEKKIVDLFLTPRASAYAPAIDAIRQADYIIAGPGDLYTTTLANIIVDGVGEAIQESNATFILVSNLMTKRGQTHWMKASDLVAEITKYTGKSPDIVVTHEGQFPEAIVDMYKQKGEYPIENNLVTNDMYTIVSDDIIANGVTIRDKGDTLLRSLIRHDAEKLGNVLSSLCR